ncbi:hypothetical protein [Persicitalea sp.]|uniref:hypothetical protein n=1 Tax=Persicitalea sp. TaxID=3100273 RepID=UPI003593CB50
MGDYAVIVEPYSKMYAEPILKFGFTKDIIIIDEQRKKISEKDDSILYEGDNSKVRNVLYIFKDKKLSSIAVLLQNTSEVATESTTYLKERYSYLGPSNNVYYFEDKDRVSLGVTVDPTLGLTVLYLPYNPNKRLSSEVEGIDEIMASLRAEVIKKK